MNKIYVVMGFLRYLGQVAMRGRASVFFVFVPASVGTTGVTAKCTNKDHKRRVYELNHARLR